MVRAGEDSGGQALGATDQERRVAAGRQPTLQQRGKFLAGWRYGSKIEGDGKGISRQGCQYGLAFSALYFRGRARGFRQFGYR